MFTPCKDLNQFNNNQIDSHFISLLDRLAMRHSYYNAFEAFLDCAINSLSKNYAHQTMEAIRTTYTQDERYILGEMIHCWIYSCNINIVDDNSYHDFPGIMYERNALTKQKGFAQYFTPEPICTFMAQILSPYTQMEAVAEPACGSGRLNLAVHACNHRLLHHANDLDYACAKMAAMNFFIHGVKGVVTCDDGLLPGTSFKGAFAVNFGSGPNIDFIDDQHTAYRFLSLVMPHERPVDKPVPETSGADTREMPSIESKIITPSQIGKQLSLF